MDAPAARMNRDASEHEDIFWSSSLDETDNETTTPSSRSHSRQIFDSRFSCNICFEAVTEPVVTQCGHLYCWPCLYKWLEPGIYAEERASLGLPPRAPAGVDESRRCCPVCKAECSIPTIVPIYVRNEPPTPQQRTSSRKQSQRRTTTTATNNNNSRQVEESEPAAAVPNTTRSMEQEEESETSVRNEQEQEEGTGLSERNEQGPAQDGLRRRLRFRSHDSDIPDVPSRPAPSSPRQRSPTPYNNNNISQQQQQHYRQPLSHGLAHSLWQSLSNEPQPIPSLHQNRSGGMNYVQDDEDATEFLWRLLLMLGSFVILCLLIF